MLDRLPRHLTGLGLGKGSDRARAGRVERRLLGGKLERRASSFAVPDRGREETAARRCQLQTCREEELETH